MRPIVLTTDATRYTQMGLCHAAVDLAFIADDGAHMLKNATHFAYNGLPWVLPPRDLHF